MLAAKASADDYPVPPPPTVSTSSTLAYYWADHVDYLSNEEVLHLKGNVLIRESTYTVKGDEMWLDDRTHIARAQGFFYVADSSAAVAGKKGGEFDLVDHSGYVNDVSAGDAGWRIHAREGDFEEVRDKQGTYRKIDYWSADFTSCDRVPPDYHFHAKHLKVYPGRHLLGYNAVFYVGRFPVFYTPIIYKPLDGGKNGLGITAQAGYDHRNGYFLKGTQTHRWNPTTYSKLFLDWYSTQGWGEGAEVEHKQGIDRTELYGYHVTENVTHLARWATLGNVYQTVASSGTSSLAVQGRLQLQSDPDFNNNYSRNNLLPVSPELINNGALQYRTSVYTARLFYSSIQDATILDPGNPHAEGNSKYFYTTEQAPGASVQTAPLKFWKLPWLNSFSGMAEQNHTRGRDFTQKDAQGAWNVSQSVNLLHGLTMTPSLTYSETVYNEFDELSNSTGTLGLVQKQYLAEPWVGRYTAQDTLRFDTPAGKWDIGYTYQRRFVPNTLDADINASDHGVEANLASIEESFRPTRRVFVRARTGYDFRTFTYQTLQAFQRIQPIVAEAYYTPTSQLTLSLRDDFLVQQGNRSFLADAQLGDPKGTFIETSAGYNRGEADSYFTNLLLGYEPSTYTWRVSGALRSIVATPGLPARLQRFDLFDKQLIWVRYWHDFFTQMMVNFRPGGVKEFTVRAQFRLPGSRGKAVEHRDWESEWFPERKAGLTDRP